MYRMFVPTEIFFGNACLKGAAFDFSQLGRKAMLITGRRSAKTSGAFDDCVCSLESCKVPFELFDRVGENPDLETIMAGAAAFKSANADFVIGIGGGSPIDAAKAVSVIAANTLNGADVYDPEKIKKAFPVAAIPTTSGTGSEVTPYSVITDSAKKKKAGFTSNLIFPKVAFVDPAYTASTGAIVTRDTAVDALSHLLEGLYSKKRNRLLYPLIFEGAKLIVENLRTALDAPNNQAARSALSQASLYGGLTIAQSGTTLQHSIGYPLTTEFGLSHGAANGVVMKYVMEFFKPSVERDLKLFFKAIGMEQQAFFDWLDSLKFDFEPNIDEAFLMKRVPEVMQSRNMAACPVDIRAEDVEAIYRRLIS